LPDEPVLEVMMNSEPVLEVVLNSKAQEVMPMPDVPVADVLVPVPDVHVPDVQKMRGPSGCGKKFRSMNKLCYDTACRSGRKKQKKYFDVMVLQFDVLNLCAMMWKRIICNLNKFQI
jgi:hypothetical protein